MLNLPPFKLERYFAQYEFSTKYLLCSSDCESLAINDLLEFEPGAEQGLKDVWLGYTESQGAPELRQEISRLYSSITPDQVLVHSGAEEAILLFMQAALQVGDHVIVQWPCYQSLFEIAKSMGCEVGFWECRPENGWAPDLDELKSLLHSNTKVVILNLPNNPTGYLMPEADFRALNKLLQARGILLFSDEVYRGLEYKPEDRLPAACDINTGAVSLGVLSKSFGLAGLRIGWIATHDTALYQRMAGLKDYTTICSSAPSEYLSSLALRHAGQIVERNQTLILHNLSLLDELFAIHTDRLEWVRPKAGPIGFPRLIGTDVEQFCHELVSAKGVLLLPGTVYDHPGNHFRLGFGRKNMPTALTILEEYLDGQDG
jgi:aspartate/methionine/tyrosine aminotransferase